MPDVHFVQRVWSGGLLNYKLRYSSRPSLWVDEEGHKNGTEKKGKRQPLVFQLRVN